MKGREDAISDGTLGSQVTFGVVAHASNSSRDEDGLNASPFPLGSGDTGYGDPAATTVCACFDQVS